MVGMRYGMERVALVAVVVVGLLSAVLTAATVQRAGKPRVGDVLKVSVTAYCVEGETKSGIQTRRGIVAADPSVLPIGTVVRISGLERLNGRYTVQDTGRAIKGRELDIFVPDCREAERFGRQDGRARIMKRGSAGIE
jgi:3D (Asp-Asp-Asp) domain-containing protein